MMKYLSARIRKAIVFISVFSILATSVFSSLSQINLNTAALGAGSKSSYVWEGADFIVPSKVSYEGGSGTLQNPYLVSNGDQLYKMVYEQGKTNFGNGEPAYFKLTNDIYLNDISDFNSWTATTEGLNDWFIKADLFSKEFSGNIDGANFTVYGLYTNKSTDVKNTAAALIPIVSQGDGCTIKNLNVSNSFIKCNKESAVLVGQLKGDSAFSCVSVHDAKITAPYSAGMAAQVWNCNINYDNCLVYNLNGDNNTFGYVGRKFDGYMQYVVTLKNCISLGYHPASYFNNTNSYKDFWMAYVYENVLTDHIDSQNGTIKVDTKYTKADGSESQPSAKGSIYSVTASQIKVDDNNNILSQNYGYDFINVWRATGKYPIFRNTDYWDGVNSGTNYDFSIFTEGKGTKDNPYLITNGDQLYAMVVTGGNSKYFKLACDIYLNDVKSAAIDDLAANELNDWMKSSKISDKAFNGYLDGGYHTVYGLYTSSGIAALIPNCANAEITNLDIAKSKLTGSQTGGIVGEIASGKTVKLTGCSVYDSYLSGSTCSGGIVASGSGNAQLERCSSYGLTMSATGSKGGLLGNVTGSNCKLTDCYSAGVYPVGAAVSSFTTANTKNVYTDVSGSGVFTKLNASQLKGDTALDSGNMVFSVKEYWQLTTGYPIMRIVVEDPNANNVWDGSSDNSWKNTDTGNSEAHPYIISTAAQLYDMISSTANSGTTYEGKYFKLKNDIYLNSVIYSDWYRIAKNGWVDADKTYFKGTFDGANHTIYGLYIKSDKENLGLFPTTQGNAVIKNLKINSAYITGKSTGTQYAGAFVGRTLDGKTTVSKCTANYNVLIGAKTAGGIIGYCGYNAGLTDKAVIEHCAFVGTFINDANGNKPTYKGGLVGNTQGGGTSGKEAAVTITDSFTTAEKAIDNGNASFNADAPVYQSGDANVSSALIKVSAQNMFGSSAISAMPNLDWGKSWKTTAFYPDINDKDYIVWSGGISSVYASGTGTEDDPFIIKNAEQLAKMVNEGGKDTSGKSAYFKVADGVKELYINDVAGMNLKETVEYLKNGTDVREWFYNSASFIGKFNGNGVTIYGIYNNSQSQKGGLLGMLGTASLVYNVNLKNSMVVVTSNTDYAGVLSAGASGNQILVKNVSVTEVYVRGRWAAAVVGNGTSSNIEFANCYVGNVDVDYNGKDVTNSGGAGGAAALISDAAWGTATVTINDCFTTGIYPVCYYRPNPQTERFILNNVYTDVNLEAQSNYSSLPAEAKEKFASINTLTTAQATGTSNPKKNMAFDWNKSWDVTSSYPVPRVHVVNNGTVGAVWSGDVADSFAGSGTKQDPFIVDTAERLARMVASRSGNVHYLITEDIRLNNISDSQWYKNSGLNVWNINTPAFSANVSGYNPNTGKMAIIYGLYVPSVKAGEYAGLFSTLGANSSVKNITLANAYLNSNVGKKENGSVIGAIAGAFADGASNSVISSCTTEKSVIINNASYAGGIIGKSLGAGFISNCASKAQITGASHLKGGFVAEAIGPCNIITSYCVGNYAAGKGGRVINVYSDVDQKLSSGASDLGVTLLESDKMIGENAKTNMVGFDFVKVWSVTAEYPKIIGETPAFDGIPGEVWVGLAANNYAGGSGTEEDPYLIATGEQLYKLVTTPTAETRGKHYKLINDIKLNNVYSENWTNKVGLNSWHSPRGGSNAFAGHFDGDYHIISGIYNETVEGYNFFGLFPLVDQGALIENTGITDCYISISTVIPETFAACIVGRTTGFGRTVDSNGVNVLIPIEEFEASGGVVPTVRNCFADHTTYAEARYGGGIVCGVPDYIKVDNCFFTGYTNGGDLIQKGAIVGDAWGEGSRITNCYSAPLNMTNFAGNSRIINAKTDKEVYIRNCYALSHRSILNVTLLPFDKNKYGGLGVKDYATGLDWENVWQTIENGTPVLRGFDKNGHTLEEFSYRGAFSSTITFVTNAEGVTLTPITGEVLSPVQLPVPSRYGYTFDGWYVYSELDVPYDRDYMPFRDITLYAKWELDGIYQTFENYPNTSYDVGDDYDHYRPGVKNYNINLVHAGGKSMHRLGKTDEESDFLINYEDELKLGSQYIMTYWMLCDTDNADVKISLVHNTWPDIAEPISKTEVILNETGVKSGEWKQYTCKFYATTPWVSFRTNGNTSLYFDDIMIVPTGLSSLNMSNGNSIFNGVLPTTGEKVVSLEICFSAFVVAFIMILLLKAKNIQRIVIRKQMRQL